MSLARLVNNLSNKKVREIAAMKMASIAFLCVLLSLYCPWGSDRSEQGLVFINLGLSLDAYHVTGGEPV